MPKITPIDSDTLGKVFIKAGFSLTRIEGDHFIYTKPGCRRPVIIPKRKDVPVFVIKNNLRTGNISREEYFELLNQI
jgi:predicted RNA binding protein YcfA (HicA-like mRNA interferase family)